MVTLRVLGPSMNEVLKKDITAIYQEIGAVVQASQHMELSIAFCLTLLRRLKFGPLSDSDFNDSMDKFSKNTFGRLIGELKKVIDVDKSAEEALLLTLNERNYIIHSFFHDNSELITIPKGRQDLLERVKLARANIRQGFQVIDVLTTELMRISGLSIADVMADIESSMSY